MSAIDKITEKASALNGTVVLPEGMDARVITAACACVDRKICTPIVLGTADEIAAAEEKAGMKLINLEGQMFDPGMAVTPLNLDEFDADEPLLVQRMIEPIVMKDGRVCRTGTAMLGRADK